MNAAIHRTTPPRDTFLLAAKIIAVVTAGLLTGALIGLAAVSAYDLVRVSEPLLYTQE